MLPIPVSVSVPERVRGRQVTPPMPETFIFLRFSKVSGGGGIAKTNSPALVQVPVLVRSRPGSDSGQDWDRIQDGFGFGFRFGFGVGAGIGFGFSVGIWIGVGLGLGIGFGTGTGIVIGARSFSDRSRSGINDHFSGAFSG